MKFKVAKRGSSCAVHFKKRRFVARLRDAMKMIVDGGT
jgi:hypothetical protein